MARAGARAQGTLSNWSPDLCDVGTTPSARTGHSAQFLHHLCTASHVLGARQEALGTCSGSQEAPWGQLE